MPIASTLFHELLHGATIGTKANNGMSISDVWMKIKNASGAFEWVAAYGPLNAKMIARIIDKNAYTWVSLKITSSPSPNRTERHCQGQMGKKAARSNLFPGSTKMLTLRQAKHNDDNWTAYAIGKCSRS